MKKMQRIGATMLVLTLFSLLALGSGTESATPTKVGEVSDKSETVTKNDSATNDKVEESIQTEYHVGDIFTAEGLKIVYVASGEYESDNQFMQPKEGNKYVFIDLAVENTSDTDKNISIFDFDCYADGYAAEAFYGGSDDGLSATMSAGRTTTGKVYYEVPVDAKEIEFEYKYNIFSDIKIKFIYEGVKDSGYVVELNTAASADAFKVGDIIDANGVKISYLNTDKCVSDNMFIQPKEGYEYVYCEFEFENTTDSDKMVSTFEFKCYADGQACDAAYAVRDDDLSTLTLSSGRKAKGTVTFEVPVGATVIEAEYEVNFWSSKHVVFTIK